MHHNHLSVFVSFYFFILHHNCIATRFTDTIVIIFSGVHTQMILFAKWRECTPSFATLAFLSFAKNGSFGGSLSLYQSLSRCYMHFVYFVWYAESAQQHNKPLAIWSRNVRTNVFRYFRILTDSYLGLILSTFLYIFQPD